MRRGGIPFGVRAIRDRGKRLRVTLKDVGCVTGFFELFARVLANRLQQAVAVARSARLDHEQRLVDQRRQPIDNVEGICRVGALQADRAVERTSAGERRHVSEQPALVRQEQLVTPIDQGAHRLLPSLAIARPTGEQPKMQATRQLL